MRGDGGMGSMKKKGHNPLRTYPATHEFSSPAEGHHEKIKSHIKSRRPGGGYRSSFGSASGHPVIAGTEQATSCEIGGHAANSSPVVQHRKNKVHHL